MSQPVYWVGGVGPHRCPLHVSGYGYLERVPQPSPRAQPQSQKLQTEAKEASRGSQYRHPVDKLDTAMVRSKFSKKLKSSLYSAHQGSGPGTATTT